MRIASDPPSRLAGWRTQRGPAPRVRARATRQATSPHGGQLAFLREDFRRASRNRRGRALNALFSEAFIGIASYRLQRAAHLRFPTRWPIVRALLAPVRMVVRPWLGPVRIDYVADIGPGLTILHGSLGVVVGHCTIGSNATFGGGNVIGVARTGTAPVIVGDRLELGTHAQLLGPLALGDRVVVGAGAVVTHDHPSGSVLGGVPARSIST